MSAPGPTLERIAVSAVIVPPRLRAVDEGHARARGESMAAHGQTTPIEVRRTTDGYELGTGAHRLRGAQLVGLTEIDALVHEADALDADEWALREILENFERFDLTALDRARNLARWKAIYERGHATAGRGGDRRSADATKARDFKARDFADRFSKVAAERLDVSERTVSEAVQIAGAITDQMYGLIHWLPHARRRGELMALARIENEVLRLDVCRTLTPAITVEETLRLRTGQKAVPAPARWERASDGFAKLKPVDQDRFLEANREAIERWLAKREARS